MNKKGYIKKDEQKRALDPTYDLIKLYHFYLILIGLIFLKINHLSQCHIFHNLLFKESHLSWLKGFAKTQNYIKTHYNLGRVIVKF